MEIKNSIIKRAEMKKIAFLSQWVACLDILTCTHFPPTLTSDIHGHTRYQASFPLKSQKEVLAHFLSPFDSSDTYVGFLLHVYVYVYTYVRIAWPFESAGFG